MTRTIGDFRNGWREECERTGQPVSPYWEPAPRVVPAQSDQLADPAPPPASAEAQRLMRIDDQVECREPAGLFRTCRCGSTDFIVMPGVGPHAAQLRCNECGSGGRWLGRALVEEASA
jgi:hypothetical protein